jgi:hypothetical protein
MGFMHATPGEMKSFRSSAERIALMVSGKDRGGGCDGAAGADIWTRKRQSAYN